VARSLGFSSTSDAATNGRTALLQRVLLRKSKNHQKASKTKLGMGQNPCTPGEHQNSWDLWIIPKLRFGSMSSLIKSSLVCQVAERLRIELHSFGNQTSLFPGESQQCKGAL
jgi:hypothetical protein